MMQAWLIRLEVDFSPPLGEGSMLASSVCLCSTSTAGLSTAPALHTLGGDVPGYSRQTGIQSAYRKPGSASLLCLFSHCSLYMPSPAANVHITLAAARYMPASILLPCHGFSSHLNFVHRL